MSKKIWIIVGGAVFSYILHFPFRLFEDWIMGQMEGWIAERLGFFVAWILPFIVVFGAIYLGYRIRNPKSTPAKIDDLGKKEIIPKSDNLTDTLTSMHRRLVELQKEKASHTKIRFKQWEKVMPTLADRMGVIELKDWPKYQKNTRKRLLKATPKRNFKRRFSLKEKNKYREKVYIAVLSVASEIKKELFQKKEWTLEDAVKVSEWLDGYRWGVKELRDTDPHWDALFKSISHFSKDEKLSGLIQKHIDLSYAYNNICLANRYSRNYPKNSFSSMLHETLVGSPISPEKVELALYEILNEIEIRLRTIKVPNMKASSLQEVLLQLAELRSKGVGIRNEGTTLDQIDKQEQWFERVNLWKENTIDTLRQISKSDAEMFKTLNLVPNIEFNCKILSPQHKKMLREHNERISRLENLIKKYDLHYHSETSFL